MLQFKLVFKYAYHMLRRYVHRYLANDQEYSVDVLNIAFDEILNKGRDVFNAWLWRWTWPRQFITEEKRLPPWSSRVRYPGIVAQVKHEVESPFLYYSRWITRPLSHSLQFKCNEPHRYIPSYSFSGSPFSPPLTQLISCHPPLQRDVISHNPDIFHHYSSGHSDGGQIINFSRN